MFFEVLQDETGTFYAEKTVKWRNNPGCVKLLNVQTEAEADRMVAGMNAGRIASGTDRGAVSEEPQAASDAAFLPGERAVPNIAPAPEEPPSKGKRKARSTGGCTHG